jgi:two-component system cell cycle response regulator CtrA
MMELGISPGGQFVLVVDSDCRRGRGVQSDLRAKGCYATFASSGQEALRFAREYEPDAVVSDWALSDMGGPELVRQIKSARFETKVILEKDDVDWRALRQAYEVAADDLLSRPELSEELLTSLKRPAPGPRNRRRNPVERIPVRPEPAGA